MAIIFPAGGAPDPDPAVPATHALIIGIGGYRHLDGGSHPKPEIRTSIGVLGQLTTAPRSARAFADFVVANAARWQAPLGSVDLILSAKPGDTAALPNGHPNSATFDVIEEAYSNWRARCDSHKDNIALLYFCGHGVEKEQQILLTEDFGRSTNNPWRHAIALDTSVLGFRRCNANTQCFFIDACREITSPLKNHDIDASPLEVPKLAQRESEFTFQMKSTAAKETALGPPNGVAYATQALIRALGGDAAAVKGNKWVVRTGGIADKITDILGLVKDDEEFRQRCPCHVTKSTPLLTLDHVPTVRLDIDCDPDTATPGAQLTCFKSVLPGDPSPQVHAGDKQALSLNVEAGMYIAAAEFGGQSFADVTEQVIAWPPMTVHDLTCEPL